MFDVNNRTNEKNGMEDMCFLRQIPGCIMPVAAKELGIRDINIIIKYMRISD